MAERRALVEGLKPAPPTDPKKEQEFVYQSQNGASKPETPKQNHHTRSPLSTRIRSDFAAALKRASLERQLSGTEPNSLQDILESAIEPWLKNNGYLI